MSVTNLPAVKVKQGDLTLFATAIKVKDLIKNNFYSVETLDPRSDPNDTGYQRLLNKARARKLTDYVVNGQEKQDAFLPTSVFLATDKSLNFDRDSNTIEFDLDSVGPFNVVDGQHRLEGLKAAAKKDARVLEFAVPVNIAVELPKLHQMCHFLIVNTTQKSVESAVEQRIVSRLTRAVDVENIPSLPKWIRNLVEKGEIEKAVRIVDYLNDSKESPWFQKINIPNASNSGTTSINQHTFVKAIVRYLLTANNPVAALNDFEKEKKVFLNYWISIADLIDSERATVLYKYNGVELFCRFSITFFTKLVAYDGIFTVDVMKKHLCDCFDNVEGEHAGVGHADYWTRGGKASGLNAGALRQVAQEMAKALHKPSMSAGIVV